MGHSMKTLNKKILGEEMTKTVEKEGNNRHTRTMIIIEETDIKTITADLDANIG